MTENLSHVAYGLRLVLVGFLFTCWGLGSALVLSLLADRIFYFRYELRWIYLIPLFGALLAAVAGLVIGMIGRIRCLRMPEELPTVRGRALAAVVLEGCGWGSLVVGVGVMIGMSFSVLPPAPWVPAVGMGFSGLLLIGGRITFLRFLRALATVVEDAVAARRARSSLTLFLADWAAGLVGVGLLAGGSAVRMDVILHPLGYLVWIAAGMSGAAGLILYDRLLGRLTRSVRAYDAADPPHPETPS